MNDALIAAVSEWSESERREGVASENLSYFRKAASDGPRALLLHGGGGEPVDLAELADDLAEHGISSVCPLLPAHARGERAMGALRFDDLVERVLEVWDALTSDGRPAVVVGQSMGAVLAVRLAGLRDPLGFVALAPAFRPYVSKRAWMLLPLALIRPARARRMFRWQMEAKRGIRETAERLPDVSCPLLAIHSDDDKSVDIRGARELLSGVASTDKRLEIVSGQGHILSRAPDRHRVIFPVVREFVSTTTAAACRTRTPGRRP